MNKDEFLETYQDLKKRFYAMEPELAVTVSDEDLDIEGYIVVWNTQISENGPLNKCGKGGTRIAKDLELEDVKRLARAMAEKNAAAGLPLGGAKSGLRADPNADDYEHKYKRFVELCAPYLYENGGIFGGFGYDVGGKPPFNAHWTCEVLQTTKSFTGKPAEMGGTDYDIEGIAGLGVAMAAKALMDIKNHPSHLSSFSVQGAGAMGSAVIKYFSEHGGVLRSISDPKFNGSWLLQNAPSKKLLSALINKEDSLALALLEKEAKLISENNDEALYQNVDVVFPCALEDSINENNAHKIQAPFLCEGANNPTTDHAHDILFKNNVLCIPDIIANPGGIIAAFVELTSEVSDDENAKTFAKVKEAKRTTEDKVKASVEELYSLVNQVNSSPDKVADYIAWRNILHGIPD
jgi:glutamate dehydrogenase (NAD(P)+)